MAVEAQFYLLLPLMALIVACVCGSRRSPWRIASGITLLIAGALTLRLVDTVVIGSLTTNDSLINSPGGIFVLATMGMQGKYLEVFAVGMLCALFYVLTVERHMLSAKRVRQLGLIALVGAIACIALAIPRVDIAGLMVVPGAQWGADVVALSTARGPGLWRAGAGDSLGRPVDTLSLRGGAYPYYRPVLLQSLSVASANHPW